ncbi:putative AdoMet-dependent methyltransferase [Popillia japonica]|uniref:tRNA (uracil-O(2)-)-methyltransferase n=1 Tax=Popillia japonica TaxID=7064 RepID=A0AAW1JBD1_POPJA
MKYGSDEAMTEIWPETTDPLKFKDMMDTELMLEKEKFGTFILRLPNYQEGYDGYGIDVRKRKIWDIYPSTTKLLVKTIFPSSTSLFPDTDWIIGNHSDELTPWIPVIAMRSSYKTNFFLLPCCSYEFSGVKYARINTSKSQYIDYLNYVQDICQMCRFIVKKDKLRIPSTKNICIVSYGRSYESEEFDLINEKVTKFIESKCGTVNKTDEWVQNFKPRDHVEKVQNCTQLNRELIQRIIKQVVVKILEISVPLNAANKAWNKGATLPFEKIVSAINKEDLKQLKDNCGGLQTLLRNHRYIFEVVNGCVKIRIPKTISEMTKYKDKPCWFFKNHPDGCPNSSELCAYSHGSKN